jgi:hypothetical protein
MPAQECLRKNACAKVIARARPLAYKSGVTVVNLPPPTAYATPP